MKTGRRIAAVSLAAVLAVGALGLGLSAARAAAVPAKAAVQSGVTVYQNGKAAVDASNLAEGFLMVRYTGGKNVRIKTRIATPNGINYDYDTNNTGAAETYPLTEGNGKYTVQVMENTSSNRYALAYSCTVDLKLRDAALPYLYSNQFVNFTADSKTAAKAKELMAGAGSDTLSKVKVVFDYVVDNFTYDYDRAASVQSGYLPVVDSVLAAKKGICFDYAAVMAAMLRSQNVPCRLVVGYAGTTYHAWINVYSPEQGWLDQVIYFDGTTWTLMDPTFTSSGKRSATIMKYVTDPANYTRNYAY